MDVLVTTFAYLKQKCAASFMEAAIYNASYEQVRVLMLLLINMHVIVYRKTSKWQTTVFSQWGKEPEQKWHLVEINRIDGKENNTRKMS